MPDRIICLLIILKKGEHWKGNNMKIKKSLKEYWIYVILLVFFLLARIVQPPISENWNDIINDIALGGFASTLVALIIKIRDDVAREKRNQILGTRALYSLFSSIAEYMDTFVRCICSMENEKLSKFAKNDFSTWNDLFKTNINTLDETTIECIIDSIVNFEEESKKILRQQDWYISEGILDVNIVNSIEKLSKVFIMKDFLLRNPVLVDNLHLMNINFLEYLKGDVDLAHFATIQYGITDNMRSNISKSVLYKEV